MLTKSKPLNKWINLKINFRNNNQFGISFALQPQELFNEYRIADGNFTIQRT